MNSRQQLVIQLGCDYVAAAVAHPQFDIETANAEHLAARCFLLAEAVANNVARAVVENAHAEDPDIKLPNQH